VPALGALGVGWANIEIASLALTGMTATEVITTVVNVLLWIVFAVIVAVLVLGVIWIAYNSLPVLRDFIKEAMGWGNLGKTTPQPKWGQLLNFLHDAGIGPLYTIEKQIKPSGITA
jgi:hypothetical protein